MATGIWLELHVRASDNKSIYDTGLPVLQAGIPFRTYGSSVNSTNEDFTGYMHFFHDNGAQIIINTPIHIAANSVQDRIWFDTTFHTMGAFGMLWYITKELWPTDQDVDAQSSIEVVSDINSDLDGVYNSQDSDDDNDGIPDLEENALWTNPLDNDTDNDGIFDQIEILEWLDPLDNDSDGDGVLDGQDSFPLDIGESLDSDNDGVWDNIDNDDDNDGIIDALITTEFLTLRTQMMIMTAL